MSFGFPEVMYALIGDPVDTFRVWRPVLAAGSSKMESDHRNDCRFKSDGAYDRYNVSCAPAAKDTKPKPAKK